MAIGNKIFILLVTLISCVGCDQASKGLARLWLKGAPPLSLFANAFRFEYAENPGAFLGMGAGLPDWQRWALLTVASSAILVILTVFVCMRKDLKTLDIFGYAMILSGGISNMIDRIVAGVVVDFMNMGIGNLRTGIFNVADMAIMAGLFVVIGAHFSEKSVPKAAPAGRAEDDQRAA